MDNTKSENVDKKPVKYLKDKKTNIKPQNMNQKILNKKIKKQKEASVAGVLKE